MHFGNAFVRFVLPNFELDPRFCEKIRRHNILSKSQFTSTKAKIDSEQGGKSVINNQPFMESGDVIYIMEDQKNSSIVGFLSGRAVYQQNPVLGIWLYKKDIASIAKKLKL